jgi:hypothetical protein
LQLNRSIPYCIITFFEVFLLGILRRKTYTFKYQSRKTALVATKPLSKNIFFWREAREEPLAISEQQEKGK